MSTRILSAILLTAAVAGRVDPSARPPTPAPEVAPGIREIVASARAQTRVTTSYDPSYVGITFPGGDVPARTGACADVVVRAFRAAGIDLQRDVHMDMLRAFSAYPHRWGLRRPDPNIDHRRVPNLMVYFRRAGKAVAVTTLPEYRPSPCAEPDGVLPARGQGRGGHDPGQGLLVGGCRSVGPGGRGHAHRSRQRRGRLRDGPALGRAQHRSGSAARGRPLPLARDRALPLLPIVCPAAPEASRPRPATFRSRFTRRTRPPNGDRSVPSGAAETRGRRLRPDAQVRDAAGRRVVLLGPEEEQGVGWVHAH